MHCGITFTFTIMTLPQNPFFRNCPMDLMIMIGLQWSPSFYGPAKGNWETGRIQEVAVGEGEALCSPYKLI